MQRTILSLFLFGASLSLHAPMATAAGKPEAKPILMAEPPAFTTGYTTEQFNENLKKYKVPIKRVTAANDSIDEASALSVQLRNIRNSFIGGNFESGNKSTAVPGAKNATDIANLLTQIEAQVKAKQITEPDARLLAAQFLVLRPMRGFVYRMRHIFEANGSHAKFSHAVAVTILRTTAAGLEVYLPTEQWKAAFQFAVEPFYVGNDLSTQKGCDKDETWHAECDISDGPHYQAWLRNELLPRLLALNDVLASLDLNKKPIYWDNKILYGTADFISSKDRFLRLGEPERLALLASTQAGISSLYGVNAYSLAGFFDAFDHIGTVYGFNAVFNAGTATSKQRYQTVSQHPGLFKLKTEARTQTFLDYSYASLKTALQNSHLAWRALESLQNDSGAQDNAVDPRLVGPFQRIMNTGYTNAFQMVGIDQSGAELAQGEVVSALVNGERVTVKLKEFFVHPPASLQDFMPVGFVEGSDDATKTIGGVDVKYRNYYKGEPSAWKYPVYNRYFPGVNGPDDVRRTARVLSQSWGGFILGLPLSLVMM